MKRFTRSFVSEIHRQEATFLTKKKNKKSSSWRGSKSRDLMFDDIHEWPMVSTRGTARRGIDRREISIARSPGDSDGIRFGIRSSNANRSISSLKELHQILSGRSIMAGCLKPGARRAERLRGIKKAGARSGSMPFVSSSSPSPAPVQWPYS